MSEVGSPKKSLVKSVSPIKVEKNINNWEDNILELVRQNIETQSGLVRRLGVSSRQARIDIKKSNTFNKTFLGQNSTAIFSTLK